MTYHPDEKSLICHQCNYHSAVPFVCPRCTSRRIKFVGIGTQKVEEQAHSTFPSARLLRWDSDVIGTNNSHTDILNRFRNHEADILIGTQMIAKGLDLPLVTLVGIINADTALNLPDFRAGERTFQLLCQVAGRAGRGTHEGKVIIQTYSPRHYAIQAAAAHNYSLFYRQELAYRRELNNPPFNRLVRLVYTHSNDTRCREEAERMAKWIIAERDSKGISNLNIIGPAPAFIQKVRNFYRWQLIMRGSDPVSLLSGINLPRGWIVDVDPLGII
jgi:primosomal protein N' (replication factor Y)